MNLINHNLSRRFDYRWHTIHQIQRRQIPKHIRPWLTTQHSITAKLRHIGELSVDVIEDRWQAPSPRERTRLQLKPREMARVRTVILRVNDVPVVYARSIIPARSIKGSWRYLPHLDNRPLGGYVYKAKALRRSPTEITQLPAGLIENCDQALWARRSIFQQYGPGILVNEAFYPAIADFTPLAGQL
ncbi:chorismate--pyruvate lyase family protein [Marinomonas ostreistagni]|uniref:chorismate--pyruvate lyase family protein n=1 Tax=Marinomonas ostreistagni TaxID=359209 RepID=UPI00194F70AA|nr:chorismate lyase [Marinomonas ostreistagni]MBM6550595.1 chorismate lyase [Marinomonas ostreistagni]